jgi:hypothetical protein
MSQSTCFARSQAKNEACLFHIFPLVALLMSVVRGVAEGFLGALVFVDVDD